VIVQPILPENPIAGSEICCSGSCVDIMQDPTNCGLCGAVCPSGICALAVSLESACFLSEPDQDCLQSCGPLTVCARGACVDSSCGGFPYCAAQDGAVGFCCGGPSNNGGTLAPVWCSDLANDPQNCGGCGFVCPSGQSCSHGVCSGTPPVCVGRIGGFCDLDGGGGYLCCSGVGCTNVESDSANCGSCGTICPAGTNCQGGSCS
jgi:hypothetical protein